jgi:hypothetical protein
VTGILVKVYDSHAEESTPIVLIVVMRHFFHLGTVTSAENVRDAKTGPGASVGEASFPPCTLNGSTLRPPALAQGALHAVAPFSWIQAPGQLGIESREERPLDTERKGELKVESVQGTESER